MAGSDELRYLYGEATFTERRKRWRREGDPQPVEHKVAYVMLDDVEVEEITQRLYDSLMSMDLDFVTCDETSGTLEDVLAHVDAVLAERIAQLDEGADTQSDGALFDVVFGLFPWESEDDEDEDEDDGDDA